MPPYLLSVIRLAATCEQAIRDITRIYVKLLHQYESIWLNLDISFFASLQLYGARVVGLGIGPANTINTEAFEILSGRNDRLIILTFKKTNSCSGGDDGSDCECSEDEDDDDDDDGNCGNSELKRVVSLICG